MQCLIAGIIIGVVIGMVIGYGCAYSDTRNAIKNLQNELDYYRRNENIK